MNYFASTYGYDTAPLQSIQQTELAYIGAIAAAGIFAYFLLPVFRKMLDDRKAKREKNAKKNRIKDLILMKEIQGEIETEMREALIHSELRSKKEGEPSA
jgi:hypothetical protein